MSLIIKTVILDTIKYNIADQDEEEKKHIFIASKIAEKMLEPFRKKQDKIKFITKFIDEIPELSYYEAAQLKNKLGEIYLEWNDE